MTIEEIFSALSAHMRKGLMIHSQLASAFSFLNLFGYQKCHTYHYYEESINCRDLEDFYLDTYHKLIPEQKIENPSIIPSNWYKYSRENVDINTKRGAIKDLMKKWIDWEKETKTLFEKSYKELEQQGEIYSAGKILYFINDVGEELKNAEKEYINLESTNYDIVHIIEEQDFLYKEHIKKIKHLYD